MVYINENETSLHFPENYEQVGKSSASFHLLSGVNLDIPLVLSKLNVIETMNTDLLQH